MITGVAMGYMIGVAVTVVLMIMFAVLSFVNAHEGDLAKIYDPDTLDLNAENDTTGAKEKDGRRKHDTDGPGKSAGSSHE